MALAAAHFETDGDPRERAALEFLETLPPPALAVSDAQLRTPVTAYVPVNDVTAPRLTGRAAPSKAQLADGLSLLPEARSRQPRTFPTIVPDDPTLFIVWRDAETSVDVRDGLGSLCRKVTHIGHSASLTQVWIEEVPRQPTWYPDDLASTVRLRVTRRGRLADLASRYQAGMRPSTAPWLGYAPSDTKASTGTPAATVFSDNLLVLRATGRLDLVSTQRLLAAMRATVLAKSTQPPPAWVSGHTADGHPLTVPHLALAALGNVGHAHADGRIMGVALILPRDIATDEAARVLRQLVNDAAGPSGLRIYDGGLFDITLRIDLGDDVPRALTGEIWTSGSRGATRWGTVTPIVLDRYPKKDIDAEVIVARACENIGLPTPSRVSVMQISRFSGAPPARAFPRYGRPGQASRLQVHADIEFPVPVRGPVLIGAGRYRGYGLCRPLSAGDTNR